VAAVIVPIVLATVAVTCVTRWPRCARTAAVAALLTASLVPFDHVTEAWRRGDPERFASLFEVRSGFFVGLAAIVGGSIAFAALLGVLVADESPEDGGSLRGVMSAVATCGLLLAVAGQVVESSKEHPWEMPLWPQIGRWWELLVTTAICVVAMWRRSAAALAAALAVSVAKAVATAQQLIAVSGIEDDPAVSTTATLVGFTAAAVAFSVALVRLLWADNVGQRA
jgi:hypothetical protein